MASEDIVQESYIAFWEKYSDADRGFDGNGDDVARALIYAIVRNKSIDYLRIHDDDRDAPVDSDGEIAEEEAEERSYDEARIWAAIRNLPKQRKQVLLMCKRDGMSYLEIAERLGLSIHTVRNHVSLAFKELRREAGVSAARILLMLLSV